MKKSLVLLAAAGLAFIGLPSVTHAQASGPFADVPTDHWAYQSVDTLQKAGIVIGYPDGTYGGRRPMTRYEFAVAIARLLAQMNPGVKAGDLATLRSDLENQIQGNTAAIQALQQLVAGFGPELTRLGVDVAANTARLDALEARVGRDEGILGSVVNEQNRLKITGEINVIGEADASRRRNGVNYLPFLDQNGVYQGAGGTQNRLLSSSDVYEDILLHLRGKLSDTTTANVDLDFGNYLSQVGNTAAFPGYPAGGATASFLHPGTLTAANEYANVYKAYVDAAVKLGPLGGGELLIGRFGNQYTKYTLKQVDADIYTNLTQTDSGDIIGDGASISLKAGPAHVNAFAVKMSADQFSEPYGGSSGTVLTTVNSGNPFTTGNVYQTLAGGPAQTRPGGLIAANHAAALDQGYGVRATFGAPEAATLGFTLEQFGLTNNGLNGLGANDGLNDANSNGGNSQFNRLTVYGADFNGALPFGLPGIKKGGLLVDASYTVSAQGFNEGFNNAGNGFRYSATDDQIGATFGGLTLKGGYQYIGPQFSAPGYWGRLGAWTNPTNVRGPVVSAKFAFTPKLSLNADYESYKAAYGNNANGSLENSPLQQGDHLFHYQVGLNYGLSSAYGVDLGYEDVKYELNNSAGTLAAAGSPHETYYNIGIGHSISTTASIKLLYQIVHYDDKGTGFDSTANGGKEDGGVAVGQFQIKF